MLPSRCIQGIVAATALLAACASDSSDPSTPAGAVVYQEVRDYRGKLVRVGWDGSHRQVLWEAPAQHYFDGDLFPSPDGRVIIFPATGGWLQVPGDSGAVTAFLPPSVEGGNTFDPAWAPDGDVIAWRIYRVDLNTSRVALAPFGSTSATLVTPDSLLVHKVSWAPDGTQLVVSAEVRPEVGDPYLALFVVSRDGSQLRELIRDPDLYPSALAWAPTGNRIAFASGGLLKTISPEGTGVRTVVSASEWSQNYASDLFWSPDARDMIAITYGGLFTTVDMEAATNIAFPRMLPAHPNPWSADGERILFLTRSGWSSPPVSWVYLSVSLPGGTGSVRLSPDSTEASSPAWLVSR